MRVVALPLICLCAVTAASAQSARNWRPEDRVLIGDWTNVVAVASAPERVFIVSPDAILSWSPLLRRWDGPFEPAVPGSLARVSAGMIDPLDNSLWLVTPDGWVHFQPDLQFWERGTAGAQLLDFAFDLAAPFDGLFLRTSAGWSRLPRGALAPIPSRGPVRPVRPATVDQALAANPALRGTASAFLLDPALRNARLTAAARSYDNLGWYLGTDGVGALFLADGTVVPQRLTFGLPGRSVGAIHAVPGGIWAITDEGANELASLVFVTGDLNEFRVFTGPAATGLPFSQGRRLLGVGSSLWAATDAGVVRFPEADPANFTLYAEADGLPDRRVASLASRHGVVVAATARGLARFADTTEAEPLAPEYAGSVRAVAIEGDTVWAGTPSGPRVAVGDVRRLVQPFSVGESASLQVTIFDFAWMADTLVALTSDQLLWKVPGVDDWRLGAPISGLVGSLRRLITDGDGFWVAGALGVGWTRLDGMPVRPLLVDSDLPGPPLDLAVDADFLWVATTGGLVRFRRAEVLP
ncbi:MAG TPA: hypothetical protein VFV65_08805 [Gemmatimonadales bacterium]|nr:hypothetical protein [Gemmatimonadales bacterium]